MNAQRSCYRFLATAVFAILAIQSPALTPKRWPQPRVKSPVNHLAGARLGPDYGKLPLTFEPNVGQTDQRVRFLTRGGGMTTFFTDTEAVMVLNRSGQVKQPDGPIRPEAAPHQVEQAVVRMRLEGASQPRQTIGLEKLPGISNYFIGNDPTKWRTDVPHYGRIQYEGVYPGIDLVWYGSERKLEYDFVVAPGADPKQIQVAYERVESLGVDAVGNLVLGTALGEVRQQKPRVYQEIGGRRVEVAARYAIVARDRVSFAVAGYDRKRELRIDPLVLDYSTYLCGSGDDKGFGIAVDAAGSAYVTGYTSSTNFPTQSTYQATYQGGTYDVFVTKLTPAGNALVYSTYLGGSGDDEAHGIAVDSGGSAYVTGVTSSTNFPTQSAVQATFQGGTYDAFVTKLTPAGDGLVYSTYLGGGNNDWAYGIAVDAAGSGYVTGYTSSTNFPTQAAFQATFQGTYDAFVTKLTPAGNALVYSTYLGGGGDDEGWAIAVDAGGAAYVAGFTGSSNFPTQAAYQTTFQGGTYDAFVTKLTPAGNALVYSTYLGSSGFDEARAIAVDAGGAAYVAGFTISSSFPTANAYQASWGGSSDGFVTKLNAYGGTGAVTLAYSTYLGGNSVDHAMGIAVDAAGAAYVTGDVGSTNFPTANAYQASSGGGYDGFVTKLNAYGGSGAVTLAYSTYLGGNGTEQPLAIAVDGAGAAYVVGYTGSTNLPTVNAYQASSGGNWDGFVTKLSIPGASLSIAKSHTGNFTQGQNGATYTVTVSNGASAVPTSGTVTVTETVPPGMTLVSMNGGAAWNCTELPACATSSVLNGGASYPAITVTVNVAWNAGTPLANSVSVSGGGSATNSTSDSTVIIASAPVLSIGKAHTGNFTQGQNGATYSVTVANFGAGPTSGTVTVAEMAPSGMTLVSMGGTGWTCPGSAANNCTRSDALSGGASYPAITVTVNVAASATSPQVNSVSVSGGGAATANTTDSTVITAAGPQALRFVPITPCRIVDTRNATGPFGGPIMSGGSSRDFAVPNSACSIPATAQAYSLNVAVVPATTLGYLTLWPAGQTRPLASTLNSLDGRIKSNAAIVPAGTGGAVSVFASDTTHVILDINGYFVPASDPTGLAFYPITPCRIADTRTATAPLGGPSLVGGQNRTLPILASACNLPATAQAYSLNFAAVPSGSLGYLTAWPTGQTRPLAASLNALTGAITANEAIVPAGTSGSIDVFASNTTNLVIDINGYFAPMGTGGLSLYGVTPCRVEDTRLPAGSTPITSLDVAVSACACGIPASAQADVMSVTVVPQGSPANLGYLTLWPQGQTRPVVSTLNALDGAITSNLAIVPTGNGSISAFASNATHLILDISGYFAP